MPDGMVVMPLLPGSLTATFVSDMPKTFGCFTDAGMPPILAAFRIGMGATAEVPTTTDTNGR